MRRVCSVTNFSFPRVTVGKSNLCAHVLQFVYNSVRAVLVVKKEEQQKRKEKKECFIRLSIVVGYA